MTSQPTEAALHAALASVRDPDLRRSLPETGAVASVGVKNGVASLALTFGMYGHPSADRIRADAEAALRKVPGVASVETRVSVEVRAGSISGANALPAVKNVIAVGSGKGGVGKSTVAANLAAGLARLGAKTGCLDADIYGPSIPTMFGAPADAKPTLVEQGGRRLMEPIEAHGVKLISMGFLVDPDKPVIWRGPMLHGALRQFFTEVAWGALDYLVVDLPPGTGDVALTLVQTVPLAGAVAVSTPQNVALLDARKAVAMFKQTNIPILGLVENMSGSVFGSGGVKSWAAAQGLEFLGDLPLAAEVRASGDSGLPVAVSSDPARSGPYLKLAQATAASLLRRILDAPAERPIAIDAGSMQV